MNKINLMLLALMTTFSIQAQELTRSTGAAIVVNNSPQATEAEIVLTQNSGEVTLGGIACTPNGDNWFFRAYDLGANGITGEVGIVGVEFFLSEANANAQLTVYAFDSVSFPEEFDITNIPTPLAVGYLDVSPDDVMRRLRADFDNPAVANADSNIVVAVFVATYTGDFYLGITEEATAPTWFASEECEFLEPTEVAEVGYPDSKHLIDLVIDDALSTNDVLTNNISIYQNPSSNVFMIDFSTNIEVLSSSLIDILGKTTGVVYNNGEMNVSALAPGIYFMNLETNLGSYNQKVVVKQ